jgi:RNA recognition motif-containing protein
VYGLTPNLPSKIISVKIPINHVNKQQKAVAFVEFGDKDAMEDAINRHHEVSSQSLNLNYDSVSIPPTL